MRAICKLLSLWLVSGLLFQGCAAYPPQQPAPYPPPAPIPVPEVKKQPIPEVEPIRPPPPKQTSTIAADFSRQAAEQTRQGKPELAAAILERGLRAAPKDAMLWSQLAEVKLEQQQYQQASSLAAKSNSLAGSNAGILQKNYWIIEEARRRGGGQ